MRNCEKCKQREVKTKNGDVSEYYHSGVVCHLAGFELALPLDAEAIGPGEGESTAAKRMLERVFKEVPRFFYGIIADAIYLNAPFINFRLKHGKGVIAGLKENNSTLLEGVRGLLETVEPQVWEEKKKKVRCRDIEGFDYQGVSIPLRALYAEETVAGKDGKQETHIWSWAAAIPKNQLPARALRHTAHSRREIENDTFNALVTHWPLDHCFKHDADAILNFVLTLFIAFVLMQSFLRSIKPERRRFVTIISLSVEICFGLDKEEVSLLWLQQKTARAP